MDLSCFSLYSKFCAKVGSGWPPPSKISVKYWTHRLTVLKGCVWQSGLLINYFTNWPHCQLLDEMTANRSSWSDWLYWWCTVGYRLDDCFAALMTDSLSERMNGHPTTWLAVSVPGWLSDYRRRLGWLRLWNESSQILTNGGRLKMIKGKKAARCGREERRGEKRRGEERREGWSQRGITLLSMLLHTWKHILHLLSLSLSPYTYLCLQTHTNTHKWKSISRCFPSCCTCESN